MWTRQPGFAGSFYPANPEKLRKDIRHYLEKVETVHLQHPVAFVVPHAGYMYSGPIAACSYAHLKGKPLEVAVVLAPSHRARFNGASVISNGVYQTPLGDILIDDAVSDMLLKNSCFMEIKEAHHVEHSLEVQLPFLQAVVPHFLLVPIIIGTTDIDMCKNIGNAVAEVLNNESRPYTIILSTDLSHYYSYDTAVKIDSVLIESLKSFDEDHLHETIASRKGEACGAGPLLAGIVASKKLGAHKVQILHYANSGDTAGPKHEVVGYLSAAFVQ